MTATRIEIGDDIVWLQRVTVTPQIHVGVDVMDGPPDPQGPNFTMYEVGIRTPVVGRMVGGFAIEPFGERRAVEHSEVMAVEHANQIDHISVYPDGPGSPYRSMDDVVDELQAMADREERTRRRNR